MNSMKIPPGFQPFRHDRVLLELLHDSYKMRGKLPEPTVCPTCGAVYHAGRWQWIAAPENAHQHTCPACHRIQDQYPAGYVVIKGPFFAAHRDEVLRLVQHQETREKAEHPLQRIMGIENLEDGVLVTTTDIHLARGLGEALHHAYQGTLELHFHPEESLLRVSWER